MGEVRTEITPVNTRDTVKAEEWLIPASAAGRLTVNATADTGARPLVINEKTREKPGPRAGEAGREPMAFVSEFAAQTPERGTM